MPDFERDLAAVTRRCDDTHAAAVAADANRDRVVRDALEASFPRQRAMAITGLTKAQVDQIRRETR